MNLARTIRLDVSDAHVFHLPAEDGAWAVTGTFAFAEGDPSAWDGKQQIAFRNGWMGTENFGRATFIQVAAITEAEYEAVVRALAAHLFEAYGAPDMLRALDAARHELDDMAALCAEHAPGTLLAIEREMTDQAITERTRAIQSDGEAPHAKIWTLVADEED